MISLINNNKPYNYDNMSEVDQLSVLTCVAKFIDDDLILKNNINNLLNELKLKNDMLDIQLQNYLYIINVDKKAYIELYIKKQQQNSLDCIDEIQQQYIYCYSNIAEIYGNDFYNYFLKNFYNGFNKLIYMKLLVNNNILLYNCNKNNVLNSSRLLYSFELSFKENYNILLENSVINTTFVLNNLFIDYLLADSDFFNLLEKNNDIMSYINYKLKQLNIDQSILELKGINLKFIIIDIIMNKNNKLIQQSSDKILKIELKDCNNFYLFETPSNLTNSTIYSTIKIRKLEYYFNIQINKAIINNVNINNLVKLLQVRELNRNSFLDQIEKSCNKILIHNKQYHNYTDINGLYKQFYIYIMLHIFSNDIDKMQGIKVRTDIIEDNYIPYISYQKNYKLLNDYNFFDQNKKIKKLMFK